MIIYKSKFVNVKYPKRTISFEINNKIQSYVLLQNSKVEIEHVDKLILTTKTYNDIKDGIIKYYLSSVGNIITNGKKKIEKINKSVETKTQKIEKIDKKIKIEKNIDEKEI